MHGQPHIRFTIIIIIIITRHADISFFPTECLTHSQFNLVHCRIII